MRALVLPKAMLDPPIEIQQRALTGFPEEPEDLPLALVCGLWPGGGFATLKPPLLPTVHSDGLLSHLQWAVKD